MKLVIEIDEKEYNEIKENKYGVFSGHIFETIRNGKPLSESKWIPVTERLPEHYDTYLVTVKDELHGGLHTIVCKYIPTNIVFRWFKQDINGGVVAWMPLPEPYKESEDNKE
jgi:hypothetical protein